MLIWVIPACLDPCSVLAFAVRVTLIHLSIHSPVSVPNLGSSVRLRAGALHGFFDTIRTPHIDLIILTFLLTGARVISAVLYGRFVRTLYGDLVLRTHIPLRSRASRLTHLQRAKSASGSPPRESAPTKFRPRHTMRKYRNTGQYSSARTVVQSSPGAPQGSRFHRAFRSTNRCIVRSQAGS